MEGSRRNKFFPLLTGCERVLLAQAKFVLAMLSLRPIQIESTRVAATVAFVQDLEKELRLNGHNGKAA